MYYINLMKKMLLLTTFAIAAVSALVYADFKDYREFVREYSPFHFENTAELSALYPESVIIFSKAQRLLWEASGVGAFITIGGEIAAIAQNGLASLPYGICGGLIVPFDTESIIYKNDLMVASTPDVHNVFYLPDCAQYNQPIPREGSYFDAAESFLCEASYTDRIVRNAFNGVEIYRDQPASQVLAIYGAGSACYFLQSSGEVDIFSATSLQIEPFSYMGGLLYASKYEHGFSGFTKRGYFTINISPQRTFEYNFYDLPENDLCMPADGSAEPFCAAYYEPEFVDTALKAEQITLTNEHILLKTGDKLAAYSRESGWIKELVTRYSLPKPCVFKDALYYRGVLGDEWQIDMNRMNDPLRVSYIPASCDPDEAYYKDGVIFLSDGTFVYRYAELSRVEGEKKLYRANDSSGAILYFNE